MMKPAVKAGKLANGAERGKGKVVHMVPSDYPVMEKALCGDQPKISWTIRENSVITCKKCLKMMEESK